MQIDHVELLVPDRIAAETWYGEWLGFKPMPEHADWVDGGPLMLTNDGGGTMLALFVGDSPENGKVERSWRRVAYRVSGAELLEFAERFRKSGQAITLPIDHARSWSVYFKDPWGNSLEVTTYDYETVKQLGQERSK